MTKTLKIAIGIAAALALAAVALAVMPRAPGDVAVDMRGNSSVHVILSDRGFQPHAIRITKGTIVIFSTSRVNQFWPASNPHPSHGLYPEFDPRAPIEPDATWSFTFDRVGTWGYHDHVRSYFTGTIYVE